MIRKQFDIEVQEKRANGGRILINTGAVDRDRDRVFPTGAQIDNYMRNPVVQWGHNYHDPWATIGKTNVLEISEDGVIADFELRPAANEADPQHVVQLLWNGGWVRTASIGFLPADSEENEHGGRDFAHWELLEWSLVPIPANQEALRLAVKGLEGAESLSEQEKAEIPEENAQNDAQEGSESDPGFAWIRRMTVLSNLEREQTLFACFHAYSIDIPEDATKLDIDEDGEIVEVPHPDAGKTVHIKHVDFVPPLEFYNEKWGDEDAIYSSGGPTQPDEDLVKAWDDEYKVLAMSEVLLSLPFAEAKAWGRHLLNGRQRPCKLTHRILHLGQRLIRQRLGKPYPNEHACRLRDPDDFEDDSFTRVDREHEGKKYSVIQGRLQGEDSMTEQAYRYPDDIWTVSEARSHCKDHDGIEFSPATGEERAVDDEDVDEVMQKFSSSPRNPFGTHSSYQFKGGQSGYKRAWRLHFSQINGGGTSASASGPIRGTIRRIAMIAAGMKPKCDVVGADSISARDGSASPLEGSFPEKPGDYGLDEWKKPETDADREGVRFSCNDLNVIKRTAVAELKWRIDHREGGEATPSEAFWLCVVEQLDDGIEPEELDALAREISELRQTIGLDALRREVKRLKEAFDDE